MMNQTDVKISERIKPMRKEIIELDKIIGMLVDRRNVLDAEIMEAIRKNEREKE